MFPIGGGRRAPWQTNANITDAYIADAKYLGYPSVGATLGSWQAAKGSHNPTAISNASFGANFDPKGRTSAKIDTVPLSSYVAIDSLAAGFNGTAVPWTICISAQIPVAPTGSAVWYLLSVTDSVLNTPVIIVWGNTGSTDFRISRRNNSNVAIASPTTFSPGTSRFVFTAVYNGSTLTTLLNGVVKDNAIAFGGGAMTGLDRFTIGLARQPSGGGYSSPTLRALYYAPTALSSTEYLALDAYARS